jgi:outer membrane autotransporter protein
MARCCTTLVVVAICLTSFGANAQTNWLAAPADNNFNNSANWSAGVPGGVTPGTFGVSNITSINSSTSFIPGLTFNPGASAYTFNFNASNVLFYARGIIDNSSAAPTLALTNGGSVTFNGTLADARVTLDSSSTLNIGNFGFSANAETANIASSGTINFVTGSSAANATINNTGGGSVKFFSSSSAGGATISNTGSGSSLEFFQSSTAANATINNVTDSVLRFFDSSSAANAIIDNSNNAGIYFLDSATASNAAITSSGGNIIFGGSATAANATINSAFGGGLFFSDTSTAANATVTTGSGSETRFLNSSTGGQARFVTSLGGTVDMSLLSSGGMTAGSIEGAGNYNLGSKQLTVGDNNLSTTVSGVIADGGIGGGVGGSLVKTGTGTLTLSGVNTYTGPTIVLGGRLALNGSITSNVTVGSAGNLGGSGTIFGSVVNNGILAPGTSIGTLTVSGSYTQAAGSTYQVEVNAAGQSDRLNVIGAPGTATINGGTVQVQAAAGNYGRSTTYTILNATGGVSGAYSNVTSNFAFLTLSLSYDANNVFLTLLLSSSAFASGALTGNQRAVGAVLDRAFPTATGDFETVLLTLTGLNTQQGPAALTTISGQQYSGFGTANISGGLMFMNVLGQQMSLARGGSGGGTRVALAEACDVACDGTVSPWSLWGSALGATGSVAGNNNSATVTYNAGGVSTGIDYRFSPNLLAGFGVGYASGNQWASGFNSRGTTDSYSGSLYGSFTQSAFYLDALAGYAYNDNQMTRQIVIPGLATRTAMGHAGANQLLGQAETGYKVAIYAPAAASLTPFARFQAMTVTQAAFSETGASSLDLNVAQQTTNSVRTVLGAELAGGIDMGWRERLALQFRLGWAHEYADTSRPLTASFAGAPTLGYTVYGAAPQRDSATVGLAANTAIAEATSVYLRYDGEVGTGIVNHVFSAGLRMSW